ncbi:MAG: DUF1850 domain-containing protein [Clostridia bacterium]|nr:DUF1850 domain-containing protein [Clostridia bacterium]
MKIRKIITGILCFIFMFCSVAFSGCTQYKDTLVVIDYDTGKEYLAIDLNGETEFCVDFIHSVNKSNVKEMYRIEDDEIVCHTLVYSAFGAGMPDVIEPPLSLSYDGEGNMIVSGYDIRFNNSDPLTIAVSIPYDHTITVGDKTYSLGEIAGHGTTVTVSVIR